MKAIFICIFLGLASAFSLPKADFNSDMLIKAIEDFKLVLETPNLSLEGFLNGFKEFFKGIVYGITFTAKQDLNIIHWCIQAPNNIFFRWLKFAEYIRSLTRDNLDFMEILMNTVGFLMGTFNDVMVCFIPYNIAQKFIMIIKDPSWETLQYVMLVTLANNGNLILQDLIGCFKELFNGNFYYAGAYIGQILYIFVIH